MTQVKRRLLDLNLTLSQTPVLYQSPYLALTLRPKYNNWIDTTGVTIIKRVQHLYSLTCLDRLKMKISDFLFCYCCCVCKEQLYITRLLVYIQFSNVMINAFNNERYQHDEERNWTYINCLLSWKQIQFTARKLPENLRFSCIYIFTQANQKNELLYQEFKWCFRW